MPELSGLYVVFQSARKRNAALAACKRLGLKDERAVVPANTRSTEESVFGRGKVPVRLGTMVFSLDIHFSKARAAEELAQVRTVLDRYLPEGAIAEICRTVERSALQGKQESHVPAQPVVAEAIPA